MTTSQTNIPDYVVTALGEILNGELNRDFTIETDAASKPGDNMMAQLLRIKVVPIPNENNPNLKFPNTNFIVKMAPQNESRRKILNIRRMYLREIIIYREVLTEFKRIHDEHGVPDEQRFKLAPEYYMSKVDEGEEIIVMEDLQVKNFKMHDRLKAITFDHARLALEALGHFHAMSFVLRDQKPEILRKFADIVAVDNLFDEDVSSVIIQYGKKYYKHLMETIQGCEEISNREEVIERVMQVHDNLKKIMTTAVSGQKNEPYSVIAHGDFWNNNILYRNNENGHPIEAKILDFQLSRYASPICDIAFYLFCCTEKKFRDKHFVTVLNCYYTALAKQIRLLGSNPDVLFPRAMFDDQIQKYFIFGFGMTVYAIPYFIAQPVDVPNLDSAADKIENGNSSSSDEEERQMVEEDVLNDLKILSKTSVPIYNRRMIGVLQDMDQYKLWRGLSIISS